MDDEFVYFFIGFELKFGDLFLLHHIIFLPLMRIPNI